MANVRGRRPSCLCPSRISRECNGGRILGEELMARNPSMPPSTILAMRQRLMEHGVDVLGESTRFERHHAIISKQDARGLPAEEYVKIHDPRNLLWVSSDLNTSHANVPYRSVAWKRLCYIYGRKPMVAWFESIQWRESPPFRWESLEV